MTVRVRIIKLKRWRASFSADRRGAAAFELVIVYPVLLLGIMLPLADVAIAGFQWLSARQALHAFGQYLMYAPPDDVGDTSSWLPTTLAKSDTLPYPISNLRVICGDGGADCSSANTESPKYYSYDTTVTIAPMVLSSVLCSDSCTFTLSYSTRFQ
jgi:Flp pilus assembly protein TadG